MKMREDQDTHIVLNETITLPSQVDRIHNLDSRPLTMEPISCPETSVRNYHYKLRNIPELKISNSQFIYHPFLWEVKNVKKTET